MDATEKADPNEAIDMVAEDSGRGNSDRDMVGRARRAHLLLPVSTSL